MQKLLMLIFHQVWIQAGLGIMLSFQRRDILLNAYIMM